MAIPVGASASLASPPLNAQQDWGIWTGAKQELWVP